MGSNVYRDLSVQLNRWNRDVKFSKRVAKDGVWVRGEQGTVTLVSIFFQGASEVDADAAVAALNKLVPNYAEEWQAEHLED